MLLFIGVIQSGMTEVNYVIVTIPWWRDLSLDKTCPLLKGCVKTLLICYPESFYFKYLVMALHDPKDLPWKGCICFYNMQYNIQNWCVSVPSILPLECLFFFQRFISICLGNRKSNLYGTLRILMCPPWVQRPPTENEWEIQLLKSLPESQLTLIHQPFVSPNYCLRLPFLLN